MMPLQLRDTTSIETFFVHLTSVSGSGRWIEFGILDSNGLPISIIAASNMALGTWQESKPSADLAETALMRNELMSHLPVYLQNVARENNMSVRGVLSAYRIALTSQDGLKLIPKEESFP